MAGQDRQQLAVIREFADAVRAHDIPFWLRGGWAMDFFVGRITRPHEDIDLFVWAADAERLVDVLSKRGFERTTGPPPARQLNFIRASVDLHVTLLERTGRGDITTASAPPEWGAWPTGMLTSGEGRLGDLSCPIVSAESQLEVKRVFRERRPGRPERAKDRADIAVLETALATRGR